MLLKYHNKSFECLFSIIKCTMFLRRFDIDIGIKFVIVSQKFTHDISTNKKRRLTNILIFLYNGK